MENQEQNLSKKQLKELRKQTKLEKRESEQNRKKTSSIIIWSAVIIFLGGTIALMAGLASKKSTNSYLGSTVQAADDNDWIKGAPIKEARINLIEYSDFQCPACASYQPMIKQLAQDADLKDKVSIIYRHFPLSQHLNARPAAQAAEAAGKQGKFWDMHDLIFINQDNWKDQKNAMDFFIGLAKTLSLDIEKFKTDYDSKEVKDKIQKDFASGVAAKIDSTPTFYLNRQRIQNPKNYDEFKRIIQRAIDSNS